MRVLPPAHQVSLCLCRSRQRLGTQDTCGGTSPWCCSVSKETSPSRRDIPGPCQGTLTLPLLALRHFFGRQGDSLPFPASHQLLLQLPGSSSPRPERVSWHLPGGVKAGTQHQSQPWAKEQQHVHSGALVRVLGAAGSSLSWALQAAGHPLPSTAAPGREGGAAGAQWRCWCCFVLGAAPWVQVLALGQ